MESTVMTTASSAVVPAPVTVTPELLAQHSITPEEYDRILAALGRTPSLTELGIYSVMWSEHCSYKSSRVHLKRLPTKSDRVVQGPTLNVAVRVAAVLRCRLSAETVLPLLRHADPEVRAIACDLARSQADINATLIELLIDLDANVRTSSACALGRFGRHEARVVLKNMLRRAPTQAAIEAIAPIADHECIVLLGRLARAQTDLKNVALEALAVIDDPLAIKLADALTSRTDPC